MSDRPVEGGDAIKRIESGFEHVLFASRWLMAPVYVGLVGGLVVLLYAFMLELAHLATRVPGLEPSDVLLGVLSLIDLSLAGNLLLIVIFSGYENFVSKIDTADDEDRPSWMGTVDFSGLKMKLIASIVAISAIALLKAFMKMAEGADISDRTLLWLVVIHVTFVISGVLLALMDWLAGLTDKH